MHRNLESAFFLTHKLVTHEKNQYDAIWLFKRFSDKRNRLTMNRALQLWFETTFVPKKAEKVNEGLPDFYGQQRDKIIGDYQEVEDKRAN